ncbi:MAG TPA: Stp1/IreP family PP2C-type Ser/Thr phosphatase [Blastocatellia bacterium]|nr:Stp1/IreP family PP2C-type Ser/Thr phosphatase [Blastocatellia bacterium]
MLTRWKKRAKTASPDNPPEQNRPVRQTCPGTDAAFPPRFTVSASLLSDGGCHREVNEDCWYYEQPADAELLARKGVLALVADGMGGHAAGDVASRMAATVISLAYYGSRRPPHDALWEAFLKANRAIYQAARKNSRMNGMGTTCTALVIHEGAAYAAQVGDSRLYLVRDGQIYLMSEDHSAVMEMVRRGVMTLEDARHHADKNVILRALGTQPEVNVSIWRSSFPVRDQDCFVLCSDGLYDLVTDEEIRATVSEAEPAAACAQLIALARERGGYDNITAGVVRLRLKGSEEESDLTPLRTTRESEPVRTSVR